MALALWYHPIHPVRRLIMAAEAAGESCKVSGLLSCGPPFWSLRGTPPVPHHHME